jgi:hypothetical protein
VPLTVAIRFESIASLSFFLRFDIILSPAPHPSPFRAFGFFPSFFFFFFFPLFFLFFLFFSLFFTLSFFLSFVLSPPRRLGQLQFCPFRSGYPSLTIFYIILLLLPFSLPLIFCVFTLPFDSKSLVLYCAPDVAAAAALPGSLKGDRA